MKFETLLIGLNLIAGANEVNPERAEPDSPSKENTSSASLPPTTLERNSKSNPMLKRLLSDIPVKISIVDVKNVFLGMSCSDPPGPNKSLVSVYKLLNHLISHCPFFNKIEGVYS